MRHLRVLVPDNLHITESKSVKRLACDRDMLPMCILCRAKYRLNIKQAITFSKTTQFSDRDEKFCVNLICYNG